VARTFAALGQENVNIIATVQGSSDCSMSFVVPPTAMKVAVGILHRDLELGSVLLSKRPAASVASPSVSWKYERAAAD